MARGVCDAGNIVIPLPRHGRLVLADVPHLTEKAKAELLASTPAHLRDARSKGIPTQGEGAIFPVSDESITCEPFILPAHWPRICGQDFGWTHPEALAWLAWDRDSDITYLYHCWRKATAPPDEVVATWRRQGDWIPIAWPHDGDNETRQAQGEAVAEQYRGMGMKMLPERAHYQDLERGNSREGSILDLFERMTTGRFKAFSHLSEFFEEKRLYHRKDGKINAIRDDIVSAVRYAHMMLRFAALKPHAGDFVRHRDTWRA